MRAVDVAEATAPLSEYAREARKGTVVVTRRGKPLAALVPVLGMDWEDLKVSTHPDFVAMMERSRRLYRPGTGTSLEEMRRRHGLDPESPQRKQRRRGKPSRRG